MRIPPKLKRAIGPFDIIIKEQRHLVAEERVRGQWRPRTQEIVQDADLSPSQKVSNFWHEIIETISGEFELGLNHQQVQALEMGIAQVIASLEEAYGKEIGEC